MLQLLPFFVNCGLRVWGLHSLGHCNRFVHKILMIPGIFSFVIFMIIVLSLLSALSGRFVSLANTRVNSFSSCGLCKRPLPARAHRKSSLVGALAPLRMTSLSSFAIDTAFAESMCNSNFFRAFFIVSLGSMFKKRCPLSLRALRALGCSCAQCCFSFC